MAKKIFTYIAIVFIPGIKMPVWAIPIHLFMSIIIGILLTLFLEEPARVFFKKYLTKRKDAQTTATLQQEIERAF